MAIEEARFSPRAAVTPKNTKNYKKNMMFILIINGNIKKHDLQNKNRKERKVF